ncbi:MAG: putative heme iron utilization protein [Planctomycetota bacterium]|jgi:putative heme iron utilization protein
MNQETESVDESAIARKLLRKIDCGVLSTMSLEMPGFPFGSITPYATMHDGRVVILVSDIAQHTKNMKADDKVCLTVMHNADGNKQEQGRATLIGHIELVPEDRVTEVSERYFAFFPEARHYSKAHAFSYYSLSPERVRYIGGFGKIFWIEKPEWHLDTPEWAADEAGMVEHMNDDHEDALKSMAKFFCGLEAEEVTLVAIDVEGCHIKADRAIGYIPFDEPATTSEEVRHAMVALTKTSRG